MRRAVVAPTARVVVAAAEAASFDELGRDAIEGVAQLAGAWGGLLYRYSADGFEVLGGSVAPTMESYGPELARQDPTQHHAVTLAPQPRIVLASRAVGRRAFERSAVYEEFYEPRDMNSITCVWLTDRPYATPGMVGLLLPRHRKRGEYDAPVRDRLSGVLPALVAAVRRCERVERLRWRHDGLEAAADVIAQFAWLVIDKRGAVVWMSARARTLLAGAAPPETIVADAMRLLACADGEAAPAKLESTVALGPASRAKAELQLSEPTPQGRVVVVRLEPTVQDVAPAAIEPLRERFGLTVAEGRVVRLIALGLGNAAIADRCGVSIETVRTHVSRVLAKLGVTTRVQAAHVVWSADRES